MDLPRPAGEKSQATPFVTHERMGQNIGVQRKVLARVIGVEKKSDLNAKKLEQIGDGGLLAERLTNIAQSLGVLGGVVKHQLQMDKVLAKEEFRRNKRQERQDKEEKLEKKRVGQKGESVGGVKVAKPKLGFLDTILDFFKNILIGSLVLKAVEWLSDKGNQKKIEEFKNTLIENAPLIIGGLLAIAALPLISTIMSLTSMLVSGISLIIAPLGWLFSPVGLLALVVAAAAGGLTFKAMNEVEKMRNRRAFGDNEEFIEKGLKTQKVLVQYGSAASAAERDKFLTKDEKSEYQLLVSYSGLLQQRGKDYNKLLKWQKQMALNKEAWARRGLDINNLPKFEQGVFNRVSGRIKEFEDKVDSSSKSIAQFESQFKLKGESLETVYGRMANPATSNALGKNQWNTPMPATGISEAGTGQSYGVGYSIKQQNIKPINDFGLGNMLNQLENLQKQEGKRLSNISTPNGGGGNTTIIDTGGGDSPDGGASANTSSADANQSPVPGFSPSNPNDLQGTTVRGILGLVN